ncbi:efflux RND transporter periplasmic adaptor subunit [Paracoccus denitrificans]|jgi:RND family efflux transporter MFP subunit|uniref:Efflux transporter, RND family, MFP subunit n=1 Tax=Paracoccus denitrificans (strain Pd 1222) TaxID=318586 RepID=A1B5E7_PARDP|nr:efflux RND transporter periplasmic adaptor subunit [Paracoccus denitrificans]ABL70741.1 efflux transporter, RND family, MFP subunit [Paracoccus denitrificans PD1222]MBB4628912.1 RND family efflux transporter MFP subunit [Paracoccus denitrificans]MCU7429967.1 efflux RND transporter periplasmic adaptor subunit [Paracoccus denitrificans]QAR26063.1 efflux RND transporter periplasmic adaptor subunit [Paracoccus denitrificans]UPV94978.1 efflux RND transporter periplasmic adaptor subunit [Paracocc
MMRKALIPAVLILVALAGGAAGFTLPWQKPKVEAAAAPRPVVSILVSDTQAAGHSIPGVIAARIEVALGFQTLGRVTARNVDIGDVVRQGEVLATLNPDDLQGDVRTAQAAVEAAQVELRTARATAERTRSLVQRNVASTAQLEQAERALAAAQAAEQQAQSELIRARDAEGFAEMRAPFDGVVSAVFINAGAVVSAGEPVLRLSTQDGIEAVIDLPDIVLSRVRQGDPYEVWSESDPGRILPATVSQIEPVADAATRTRRIHLALGQDADLRLGALVRARIAGAAAAQLVLPQSAIIEQDGAEHVWVVSRDGEQGTVALRRIETLGPPVGGRIAVASGLAPGEEVVIRGIHSLTEGQSVGQSVTP